MKAISLWVIIVCLNKDTGNMTQRGFCVLGVCVYVSVRACGGHETNRPAFFGHNITSRRKHALWDSRSGRYSANFPPQESNPWNHRRRSLRE